MYTSLEEPFPNEAMCFLLKTTSLVPLPHSGSPLSSGATHNPPVLPLLLPSKSVDANPQASIWMVYGWAAFPTTFWTIQLQTWGIWLWNDKKGLLVHPALHSEKESTVKASVPLRKLSGLKRQPLIKRVTQGTFQNCKADLQVNYKHS